MEIRKNTPRRLSAKVLGLVLTLGVLVALALPTQALAHHANATFTCAEVTYNYLAFNNAPDNTTTYTVKIDPGTLDEQIISGKHMLAGKNGMGTVSLPVPVGDHDIEAWTEWDTSGHKRASTRSGRTP